MRRADALILGGGPAGAAAAIGLARGGRKPLLIERRLDARGTVCGGFLSADTLAALECLGIDVASLGAHSIDHVRIVAGDRIATARLPWRAAGLSRETLDDALLEQAAACGAGIERGVAVRRIEGDAVLLADGARVEAETILLATGKHALRGAPREGAPEGSVGLRATIAPTPGLEGMIELHLFRGGYAGLLLREGGRANLCLSVSPGRLRDAGGNGDALLQSLADEAPRLLDRVRDLPGAWDSVAGVPYGWRARATEGGRYRVGDQAAVVASLVGDGMGIALGSGRAAAAAILRGESAPTFQRSFARRAALPIGIAERARWAAESPARARRAIPWLARAPWTLRLLARLTRIGD